MPGDTSSTKDGRREINAKAKIKAGGWVTERKCRHDSLQRDGGKEGQRIEAMAMSRITERKGAKK